MKSFLDLIKFLYGPKAISSTVGTRTNVIRLPSGKLQKYLSKELNIEAASDAAAVNAYNEMKELIPEVAKMNDAERLIFEGNLRRLKNKLEDSGLIQKENVSSGITALESKVEQLKQKGKELEKVTGEKATLTDVLNDLGASQQSMSRLNDEGLVRAAARQILINDIKAGKIKNITVSEAINMGEPLDPFRQIYGEGALEQLDSLIPNLRGLKTEVEAEKLRKDALLLQEAGCFAIVLEKIPANLAKEVTESLSIPTIGIGAGGDCDGQVLVMHDLLGINTDFKPRFLRTYLNLEEQISTAVKQYIQDVKTKDFPNELEQY